MIPGLHRYKNECPNVQKLACLVIIHDIHEFVSLHEFRAELKSVTVSLQRSLSAGFCLARRTDIEKVLPGNLHEPPFSKEVKFWSVQLRQHIKLLL